MAVKLRDIAAAAGVSVATVSQALNGYTKTGLRQETCDRVRTLAKQMGYTPNAIARSLKMQRTHAVGFYTGYGYRDARDPFLAEMFTGIRHGCDELKLDFLIHGDLGEGDDPQEIRVRLGNGRVDGIILHAQPSDPVARCLAEGVLPAVAIADRQEDIPSVVADDVQGMRLLVDYLWEKGHRRIAFLTSEIPLASVAERAATLVGLVEARGGIADVETFPFHGAAEYLKALMVRKERYTAVCCWNDTSAYHLLGACAEVGVRVPADLAVVGFDGLLETRLPARRLVTAAVPWERMAREAVRHVVDLRDGKPVPPLSVFPVKLIDGDTA